jgi:pantoate--beta-alanine ligase
VSTVVTKLLCMAMPDVAYFGQKDAQQVVVIRRLAADLNLPVRIEALPTIREADGLALSSRNTLLAPDERARALALPAALRAAARCTAAGEHSAAALLDAAHAAMRSFDVEPEYLALVDPNTLEPMEQLEGEALLAIAARVGAVRLIDNTILSPVAAAENAAGAGNAPSQPLEGKATATCSA